MKNIAKKSEKVKVSKKEIARVEIQQKLAHIGGGFNDLGVALRNGAFFDTQRQRQRKPKRYEIKIFDENFGIIIKRDENTILHQRVFEATLELGKPIDDEKLIIENMYQLKKLSGINTDMSDNEIIKMLTEILTTTIELYKKNESTGKFELYSAFHLIGNIVPIDNHNPTTKANSPKQLEIRLDKEFKKAVNSLTKVKIDRNLLQYIHQNIKSAYIDRIVKFFLTQQRNQSFEKAGFWALIKMISDFPITNKNKQTVEYKIDNLTDRHKRRILAEIEKESDKMKEFGIEFNRKEQKISFIFANNIHKNKVIIAYPSLPKPTPPNHPLFINKSGGFFKKQKINILF